MTVASVSFNCLALDVERPVGVERFARNILGGVQLSDVKLNCYTRTNVQNLAALFGPEFLDRTTRVDQKRLWVGSTVMRILIEMLILPVLTYRDDVVVSVNNFGPLWGKGKQSRLVVIHDVWFMSDSYEGSGIKKWFFKCLLRIQISRSTRVITVSEFSRKEIARYFNIHLNDIALVSNCVDDDIKISEALVTEEDCYLLLVGSDRRNKNVPRAVEGFRLFVESHPDFAVRLVIVGKYSSQFFANIKNKYSDKVDLLELAGYVDDARLGDLYRNCRAVIFPSLYEGFGLPAVEAILRGKPVLVANNTACADIVSPFGTVVDATSPSAIAIGIAMLLDNPVDTASTRFQDFRESILNCGKQSAVLTSLINEGH